MSLDSTNVQDVHEKEFEDAAQVLDVVDDQIVQIVVLGVPDSGDGRRNQMQYWNV